MPWDRLVSSKIEQRQLEILTDWLSNAQFVFRNADILPHLWHNRIHLFDPAFEDAVIYKIIQKVSRYSLNNISSKITKKAHDKAWGDGPKPEMIWFWATEMGWWKGVISMLNWVRYLGTGYNSTNPMPAMNLVELLHSFLCEGLFVGHSYYVVILMGLRQIDRAVNRPIIAERAKLEIRVRNRHWENLTLYSWNQYIKER